MHKANAHQCMMIESITMLVKFDEEKLDASQCAIVPFETAPPRNSPKISQPMDNPVGFCRAESSDWEGFCVEVEQFADGVMIDAFVFTHKFSMGDSSMGPCLVFVPPHGVPISRVQIKVSVKPFLDNVYRAVFVLSSGCVKCACVCAAWLGVGVSSHCSMFVQFVFSSCSACIHYVFKSYSRYVQFVCRLCSVWFRFVLSWCTVCVQFVLSVCSVCVQFVFSLSSRCVHVVFSLCTIYVQFMFSLCSICVQFVFGLCSTCFQCVLNLRSSLP